MTYQQFSQIEQRQLNNKSVFKYTDCRCHLHNRLRNLHVGYNDCGNCCYSCNSDLEVLPAADQTGPNNNYLLSNKGGFQAKNQQFWPKMWFKGELIKTLSLNEWERV